MNSLNPTGALFIIAGTAVGAGMLGLPLASSSLNFFSSTLLLFLAWSYSLVAGMIILKLYRQHQTTDFPELAKKILGPWAKVAMLLAFNLLCGSLMATYSAGGGEILQKISLHAGLNLHSPLPFVLTFCTVLSTIIFKGIQASDQANRTLFLGKILCLLLMGYLLLSALGQTLLFSLQSSMRSCTTYAHLQNISQCSQKGHIFLIFLASFGYHVALPSVFHHAQKNSLQRILLLSTLLPLAMYLFWEALVKGAVFSQAMSYQTITESPQKLSALLSELGKNHPLLLPLSSWFSFFAISTSYLGVGVALFNSLTQSIKFKKATYMPFALAFFLPLLIAVFTPQLFVKGLAWAGVASTTYAMLIPGLMGAKSLPSPMWRATSILSTVIGFIIILCEFI